ncbi:MAG: hypothetical protein NDJ89_03400 [Oligoflexia bacterium]|nr:hypothetical protein [Oligoflexia bacterium]
MRKITLTLVLVLGAWLLTSLSSPGSQASTPIQCPAENSGEGPEDCPWGGIARALILEAEAGRAVLPKFQELAPAIAQQAAKDSERKAFKHLWGKSINFDEMVKDVIVHPAILETLGQIFGEEGRGRIVHAGMEHTYGYLLSVLKTSFGYKRARWVRPTIEQGLGLPADAINPLPQEGTFFGNVTYVLSQIAFRDDGALLESIHKIAQGTVPPSIASYPFSKLRITRLEEAVSVKKPSPRTVILRTDFVPFFKIPAGQANSHLLVYSVLDPLSGGARLVTAFPVEKPFVERALNPKNLGRDQPVITRYNAFVEGLTGQQHTGNRQVVSATRSTHGSR